MSQAAEEQTIVPTRASSPALPDEKQQVGITEKGDAEAQVLQAPKIDFTEGGLRGWATLLGA